MLRLDSRTGWLVAIVGIVSLILLLVTQLRERDSVEFNSEEWKRSIESRDAMFSDLLSRTLTPGLSRQEVEELLGMPDRAYSPDEYAYCLGLEKGSFIRIDHDWLIVRFLEDTVIAITRRPD